LVSVKYVTVSRLVLTPVDYPVKKLVIVDVMKGLKYKVGSVNEYSMQEKLERRLIKYLKQPCITVVAVLSQTHAIRGSKPTSGQVFLHRLGRRREIPY
jgi:hypothetical protein